MDFFKIIVVLVALLLLITILTIIGFLINTSNHVGTVYPPTINSCPDGWLKDTRTKTTNSISGAKFSGCIIPKNNVNLGTLTNYPNIRGYYKIDDVEGINFDDSLWFGNGMTAECNKKMWANTNGIVWDTITNYNQC